MLSLATVRSRWASLLGTFVALLLGATMLTLAALAFWSAQPQVPQRLSVAPIIVAQGGTSAPDFAPAPALRDPQGLIARLEAIPGVRQAIPDTPGYAQVVIDGKPVAGTAGNSFAALALSPHGLSAGRAPVSDSEVAVSDSLGLSPGEKVTILTTAGPADFTVSGTVSGPGVFFNKPSPRVPAIGLLTDGKVDLSEVESAVAGQAKVFSGDARAALEPAADARTRWIGLQVISGISALSAFAAIFLVGSTFSFSVLQRRRELGLLRAIGATPKQLRRMMLGEALVLGVAAAVIGVGLGSLGAPWLGNLLIDAGFEPSTFDIVYHPVPLAAAPVLAILVALAGVWSASRRAARVAPLEALRVSEVERVPMTRGRWIGGIVALALGGLMAVVAAGADALNLPTYAGGSAMALTVGLGLLSPVFVPPLARLIMTPWRHGPVGLLVRQNAFTAARRTASTAAPILLSVAFAVLISGMVQTSTSAYAAGRADALPAVAAMVPDGTPGLTDAHVRSVPAGQALTPTTVFVDGKPVSVMGRSDVTGVIAAPWLGVQAGQAVQVTVANGASLSVQVSAVDPDQPFGIVTSRDWVLEHDSTALTAAVLLQSASSSSLAGSRIVDAPTYAEEADSAEDRLVWTFTLLLVATAVGFTLLAVANTVAMASFARREEFRLLAKSGATRGQSLRLAAAETSLVVFLGVALGLLVALPALQAIRWGLSEEIGRSVPLVMPWSTLAIVSAACLLLALLAATVPISRSRHT